MARIASKASVTTLLGLIVIFSELKWLYTNSLIAWLSYACPLLGFFAFGDFFADEFCRKLFSFDIFCW